MNFYRVGRDIWKRKKFASGALVEDHKSEKKRCPVCGVEWYIPGFDWWFNNKSWDMKIYMDREHYADFASVALRRIVSEKAKGVLTENFSNAIDFGNIEMVSLRDLSDAFLKKSRDLYGSRETKLIANDPPQYYRLLIKQGADADLQKSNKVLEVDCPVCGLKRYDDIDISLSSRIPTHIIGSTWKCYDIFYVEGMGNTVFCTEKFIEIYNKNELTGLVFEQVPTV